MTACFGVLIVSLVVFIGLLALLDQFRSDLRSVDRKVIVLLLTVALLCVSGWSLHGILAASAVGKTKAVEADGYAPGAAPKADVGKPADTPDEAYVSSTSLGPPQASRPRRSNTTRVRGGYVRREGAR